MTLHKVSTPHDSQQPLPHSFTSAESKHRCGGKYGFTGTLFHSRDSVACRVLRHVHPLRRAGADRTPATPASLPPAPSALLWPDAAAAKRGTTLLVESTDSVFPHICKLDHINPDDIICQGGRHPGDGNFGRLAGSTFLGLRGGRCVAFLDGAGVVLSLT